MAKKAIKIQTGNVVDYTATAVIANGDVIELTDRIGVAQGNAEIGEVVALDLVGVYDIVAADADAIAFGDKVYYDAAGGNITTATDSVGDGTGTAYTPAGIAISTKAGATAGNVWVRIG